VELILKRQWGGTPVLQVLDDVTVEKPGEAPQLLHF